MSNYRTEFISLLAQALTLGCALKHSSCPVSLLNAEANHTGRCPFNNTRCSEVTSYMWTSFLETLISSKGKGAPQETEKPQEVSKPKENTLQKEDYGHILLTAQSLLNQEKAQTYGSPQESFRRICDFWNTYLEGIGRPNSHHIQPKDVACMMALLKISREISQHKEDNLLDGAAYLALAQDLADPSSPSSKEED